jgi:hypothetical protein
LGSRITRLGNRPVKIGLGFPVDTDISVGRVPPQPARKGTARNETSNLQHVIRFTLVVSNDTLLPR